jgi:L-iditol 2-dehydrogenase
MNEKTMRAIVKYQKGDGFMELRKVPIPEPAADEVLIKVWACGVCGSDLHILHDEHPNYPPVIVGHEYAGEIVTLGEEVQGWQIEDRVVGETHTRACGRCLFCRTGNQQICSEKLPPGWGIDGAYAEYIAYPVRLLHHIPDNLSWDEATLAEPTAICVHGILERTLKAATDSTLRSGGETVVVIGPGPIGLLSLQLVKAAGAGKVIVSGTPRSAARRLPLAKELGADCVVNVGEQDLKELVLDVTSGYGADIVVESSGASSGVVSAYEVVRRLGKICFIGISGQQSIAIPHDQAIFKAATAIYSFSHRYTSWETALQLLSNGKIKAIPLITDTGPLERWEEIFQSLEHGGGIKGILHPQETA